MESAESRIGIVSAGHRTDLDGRIDPSHLRWTAKLLLDELHNLPADGHAAEQLLSIRSRAVAELEASLPDHLSEEFLHVAPSLPVTAEPTWADTCIAEGLLAAWLEGLAQGVRLAAAVHEHPAHT